METICMKCQILFSEKTKKNVINLSSELAQTVQKVNAKIHWQWTVLSAYIMAFLSDRQIDREKTLFSSVKWMTLDTTEMMVVEVANYTFQNKIAT